MKCLQLFLTISITVLLFWGGNTRFGSIPPMAKFIDPFHGFWSNDNNHNLEEKLILPGLHGEVTILWDEREIPHIFAENNHDLYLAQGYVTAKHRLWQMEFVSHLAAGRLSEILGFSRSKKNDIRDLDIENRKIGLLYAAQNSIKEMENYEDIKVVMNSYSEGVNLYINSLEYSSYPIEYKIFDYKPEAWTPLKTALIHKYMARDLSFRDRDREMTNIFDTFGQQTLADLFPLRDAEFPIIAKERKWDFSVEKTDDRNAFHTPSHDVLYPHRPDDHKGSNNWAVSGAKTKSGKPMLANDPHLGLSLPSIWYESQLVNTEVNVYGVTIPGVPGIIIGFNQNIAWGVTNAEWDVVDWYKIKFQTPEKKHYQFDDEWLPTKRTNEVVKGYGEEDYAFDLIYTHHGPVPVDEPFPYALRWLAHDPSLEFRTFYSLNRAKNYEEYKTALEYYSCPAQNFVFADVNGDISIWHNGKLPIKRNGQGRMVEDGSVSSSEWQGYIPHEQKPFIKNPTTNYVSSANEHPTDETYPYFYNGKYEYYRNERIQKRLSEMNDIEMQDFNDLLNDNFNVHASTILPTLLQTISRENLEQKHLDLLQILSEWDYYNNPEVQGIAPSIFDAWWESLFVSIWDEFEDKDKFVTPSWHQTVQLIVHHADSPWIDNKSTPEKENSENVVLASFLTATKTLFEKLGPLKVNNMINPSWYWGNYQGTDVRHFLRIPAFSENRLYTGGGRHIVNATRKHAGPSWRMIVELTTPIKAWGVYPGGQSGNPGSSNYNAFIPKWTNGELYELVYLYSAEDKKEKIVQKTTMGAK